MAQPFLSLATMAVNAAYDNLTAITGGNSLVVGDNGANWVWHFFDLTYGRNKRSGGGEDSLTTVMFNDTGSVPTFSFTTYRTKTYEIHDANDVNGNDTNAAEPGSSSSNSIVIPASQINSGLTYTFAVGQAMKQIVWPGGLQQGTYTAKISVADASLSPITITLPAATGSTVDAWFKAQVCTKNPTTATIEIRRTVAPASAGRIVTQCLIIEPPTPAPVPRGAKNWLTYIGLMGS